MLVGCPAGDEWTWQTAAGYQSGLVSVSAGATLYVFLCIFFRERRRSGRGKRCRSQPQVSTRPFSLLFSLCVAFWSCELHHVSIDTWSFTVYCCIFTNAHKLWKAANLPVDGAFLKILNVCTFHPDSGFSRLAWLLWRQHSPVCIHPTIHPSLIPVFTNYTYFGISLSILYDYLPTLGFAPFVCLLLYSVSFCWPCLAALMSLLSAPQL